MKVINGKKPLCFVGDQIILGKNNEIYFVDVNTLNTEKKILLPSTHQNRFLGKSKLLTRLFRLGVINAEYYQNILYLTYNKRIYSVNINDYSVKEEYKFHRGRGPLYIAKIDNLPGFVSGIYFGEYFGNDSKESVSIYRRSHEGEYEVVHTFEEGEINHIHNIIADHYNDCVWILTGDFGDAAAIWRTDNNFKSVEPVLRGSQQYRACIAFPTKDGLLYATDSQFEENYIRLLSYKNQKAISKKIIPVNGSVIYGCKVKGNYNFSTSTEPGEGNGSGLAKWFETKRGAGIKKNESHIVSGNPDDGFEIIYINKKDFLPYRLFQFGTVQFPSGNNPTDYLFSYSVANKTNDMDTEIRKLKLAKRLYN